MSRPWIAIGVAALAVPTLAVAVSLGGLPGKKSGFWAGGKGPTFRGASGGGPVTISGGGKLNGAYVPSPKWAETGSREGELMLAAFLGPGGKLAVTRWSTASGTAWFVVAADTSSGALATDSSRPLLALSSQNTDPKKFPAALSAGGKVIARG